jgi:N-methylhydantoinase A
MPLATARAQQALAALAEKIGAAGPEAAALDVITVANATMERAIRRISVERGYDPRRFTLVAFGGAGPLHACDLATRLQIPRVLVPTVPGVLSALGMLAAPPSRSYSRTVMLPVSPEWTAAALNDEFRPLEAQAIAEMTAGGPPANSLVLHRAVDLRYRGQSHE